MAEAQEGWNDPLVTELVPLETFYPAEDYHQDYYKKNPYQGYCMVVIRPKLNKFRKTFAEKRKVQS
jgi:peptide-methionine (S)-S-oxide reductase